MSSEFDFVKLGDSGPAKARQPVIYYTSSGGDKLVIDAVLTSAAQVDHLIRVLQANRLIFAGAKP